MAPDPDVPAPCWWQLTRLEQVALLLGALIGLGAAAPLVWLSAEALRTGHTELTAASHLFPRALLLVWLFGALIGGALAAQLARRLSGREGSISAMGHVGRLVAGTVAVAVLAPLPLALVALASTGHATTFGLYYLASGGLVGWQPGVISFVFLYTFRVLEQRRG